MEPTPVAFIHTSPAAIPPLMQYFGANAPDLEITNLLDDGLLRFFRAGNEDAVEQRLLEMVASARGLYRARAVLVTCSSVSSRMVAALERSSGVPSIKIDDPMAAQAVRTGRRIGVAVTFPPTRASTESLLREAARAAGREIEITFDVRAEAYDALLAGDAARHDGMLESAIESLALTNDVVVLAQVSMARILPRIEGKFWVPVLSSLPASLEAIRKRL